MVTANESTEPLLRHCHHRSVSILGARSSLSANLDLESALGVQRVDRVLVVTTLAVIILGRVEHRFCFIQSHHSIRDDSGLQESDPSMQLGRGQFSAGCGILSHIRARWLGLNAAERAKTGSCDSSRKAMQGLELPQTSEPLEPRPSGDIVGRDAAVTKRTRISPSVAAAATRGHPIRVSAAEASCRSAGRTCPRPCDVYPFHVGAWRRCCVVWR